VTEANGVFTLLDEAGRPQDFTLVDVVEVDQQRYAVLQPVAGAIPWDRDAAMVFRVENDTLIAIEDEAELERVVEALEATDSYDDITVLDG
jgi:hypothetical protein